MRLNAFITTFEENKLFDVLYYHMPSRWHSINIDEFGLRAEDWSHEIKFIADNEIDVSDEIKGLPTDTGGIYIFFIKGIVIPYFEVYLAYIGRAQFSESQNLKQRCNAYYYEFFKEESRPKIFRMIEKWGKYLYLLYYPLTDNNIINELEVKLINAILPPFNDEIPEMIFKAPEPAF